jgi:hypothetical protein
MVAILLLPLIIAADIAGDAAGTVSPAVFILLASQNVAAQVAIEFRKLIPIDIHVGCVARHASLAFPFAP